MIDFRWRLVCADGGQANAAAKCVRGNAQMRWRQAMREPGPLLLMMSAVTAMLCDVRDFSVRWGL